VEVLQYCNNESHVLLAHGDEVSYKCSCTCCCHVRGIGMSCLQETQPWHITSPVCSNLGGSLCSAPYPRVPRISLCVLRSLGSACHGSLGRLSGSGLNSCPRGKGSVGCDAPHSTATRNRKDQWGERVCTKRGCHCGCLHQRLGCQCVRYGK